jgi:hypothetical protein
MKMKVLTIVLEFKNEEIWGRTKSENNFLLTTVGKSKQEVTNNLIESIADFIKHEGQDSEEWKNVKIENINFVYQYDLTSFFEIFDVINISKFAKMADIHPSLARQYAKGLAYVSEKQIKKIEGAINRLGQELAQVELV